MPTRIRHHLQVLILFLAIGSTHAANHAHLPVDYTPLANGLPVMEPSENAGRTDSYQAHTRFARNDYWVHANHCDLSKPLGVALFFHGQGGHKGADKLWFLKANELQAMNMILINMQYQDGDNSKNTGEKVAAAKEALAQVMADYPIIMGRGIIGAFSGGGLPLSQFTTDLAANKKSKRGYHWPFAMIAPIGANFRVNPANVTIPMTWYIALGEKEAQQTRAVGPDMLRCAINMSQTYKDNPDFRLHMEKGKGHAISNIDRHNMLELWQRSEVFYAPIIRTQDLNPKTFKKTSPLVLNHRYADLEKDLEKIITNKRNTPEDIAQAEALMRLSQERTDTLSKVLTQLLAEDPIVGLHYTTRIAKQHLRKHSKGKEIMNAAKEISRAPATKKAIAFQAMWYDHIIKILSGTADQNMADTLLEKAQDNAPPTSQIGLWASELKALD